MSVKWKSADIRRWARERLLNKDSSPLINKSKGEKKPQDLQETSENSTSSTFLKNLILNSKTGFDALREGEGRPSSDYSNSQCVVVYDSKDDDNGEEICRLTKTLGIKVFTSIGHSLKTSSIRPSMYFSEDYVDSFLELIAENNLALVIVDFPLNAGQIRNMEERLKVPVLDREGIVLAIFEEHASGHVAKIQIELAQMKYLSARLSGLWMGHSRQRGAKGGLGARGQGETQLEYDRRRVRQRIALLNRKLNKVAKNIRVQSDRRKQLKRVSLLGYTNSGKSTLLAALSQSEDLGSDQLFSTLESRTRLLQPLTKPKILVSDTIGFINKLSPDLMASFRSTLMESQESDFLLMLVDASHPLFLEHLRACQALLKKLKLHDKPAFCVFNKMDLLKNESEKMRFKNFSARLHEVQDYQKLFWLSAKSKKEVSELTLALGDVLKASMTPWNNTL